MRIRRTRLPLSLACLLAVCAAASPSLARAQAADSALVAEARAFMEGYARDLGTGDRAAVAARYDRRGAFIIFNGERRFSAWDAIDARYRTTWRPPAAFAWDELIYEPAGPDAVVVNGLFFWTVEAGTSPIRFSYTALLLRQDGELRIRLENEFQPPAPIPAP